MGKTGRVSIPPTTDYQLVYLQYERLHRTHPHWPLSDLRGLTPRQRKYWMRMGVIRVQQRQRETKRVIEQGGIPVG